MHRHQLEKEHQYNKINKVIGIRILDFQAIKNDEDYFHKCRLYFADKEENKAPFKNESLDCFGNRHGQDFNMDFVFTGFCSVNNQ